MNTPKPLKIACVAISEMGHFIPMSHIVTLSTYSSNVAMTFILSPKAMRCDAYNGHNTSPRSEDAKIMTSIDCKNQIFTDDGMTA